MRFFLTFALLLLHLFTFASGQFNYAGYFKNSLAQGKHGNKHKCINNPGAKGNEFRLGNECGLYGEASFRYEVLDDNSKTRFMGVTTFAYYGNANTQYGDDNTNDIDTIETYVQITPSSESGYNLWAGKRFYRDADIMMNDFFYFASMSGVGAGLKDMKLGSGKFSAAYLQQGVTSDSDNKKVKTYLDFRYFDLPLFADNAINLWATLASAPAYEKGSDKYENLSGALFGARLRTNIDKGFQDFAVVYGQKLMSSLDIYGSNKIKTDTNNDEKYSIRFTEHIVKRLSSKWEMALASTYEITQTKKDSEKTTWFNIGTRPKYYLDAHQGIIAELGLSIVDDGVNRRLSRYSLAHEYGLRESIFPGITIRSFLSYSNWNQANKSNFDNLPDYFNIGFQVEASL